MNIIICGAGQVGTHAAEVLGAAGHDITVIDTDPERLRAVADTMDVATCCGNGAEAAVQREAGGDHCDLLLAATGSDEVNLLTATIAKGVGATKTIARVHHGSFFEHRGLDYRQYLSIDRLICPEYSTALAIASTLRNPGALAIETFARGAIQMQQFPVSDDATAIGKPLSELSLPLGARLAAITRNGEAFIPEASSAVQTGDTVILVGNASAFQEARKLFHDDKLGRRRVVLMGGSAMAVWLCRALHDRNFSIRLFETDHQRAEELADKLDWVTVLQASPTDRNVFEEEHIGQADVFVALRGDDEDNIIASVLAKSLGVTQVIAVVAGSTYLDLVYHLGVDQAFSPSVVATTEIQMTLDDRPLQKLSSLADGVVDAYRVRVGDDAPVIGKALREVKLTPHWIIAAIRRGDRAWVPGADDTLQPTDTALVIGPHGRDKELKKLFAAG
ncbi:MAG: Trk system potassium transporter TrkA [Planctomycetota bacterium]|nr:Trk system potassium transporter TrkA [Planctomycetota bacterium]MCZ6493460.1 Trk system potassium transporter TrkA [Planctomycetota bacterium]MCZ6611085.1 Trk system potassium transporter TrkA [Planctomycetota bacterium]MCZ6736277.1 Trk system potassium transporter TrkA [Planctomycetota bacterium]